MCFKRCDWLSLRCLGLWIKHMSPMYRSVWQLYLNQSVLKIWKFDRMENNVFMLLCKYILIVTIDIYHYLTFQGFFVASFCLSNNIQEVWVLLLPLPIDAIRTPPNKMKINCILHQEPGIWYPIRIWFMNCLMWRKSPARPYKSSIETCSK